MFDRREKRRNWLTAASVGLNPKLVACSAVGVALAVLASPSAQALTLEEAVNYAVQTNPEIGEAIANRRAIDFELEQARALYLPQVNIEGFIGPGFRDRPDFLDDDTEEILLRRGVSGTVVQTIFDGFGIDSEVERQAARIDAAAYRILERSSAVGLDAVQTYLDALRLLEQIQLSRANVQTHQAIVSQVQQRRSGGLSDDADVRQAQERLRNAEVELVDFERDFEDVRLAFERIVGLPAGQFIEPDPMIGRIPDNVDTAVSEALGSNSTLGLVAADLDVAYAEYNASVANFYPTFTLEGTASYGEDINGVEGPDWDVQALLVMRYDLFTGGRDSANRQEQIRRIDEVRQRSMRFEREIEELVRQSYARLDSEQRRRLLLGEQLTAASQVVSLYREQFDIGQRTLLDVLDGENALYNARVSETTSRYAEVFARYRILAATGQLLAAMNISPPLSSDTDARIGAGVPDTPPAETMPRRDTGWPPRF